MCFGVVYQKIKEKKEISQTLSRMYLYHFMGNQHSKTHNVETLDDVSFRQLSERKVQERKK